MNAKQKQKYWREQRERHTGEFIARIMNYEHGIGNLHIIDSLLQQIHTDIKLEMYGNNEDQIKKIPILRLHGAILKK